MTTSTTARTQRWMDISIPTKTKKTHHAAFFITCAIFQIHVDQVGPAWAVYWHHGFRSVPSTSVTDASWKKIGGFFAIFEFKHRLFLLFTYVVYFLVCHSPSSAWSRFYERTQMKSMEILFTTPHSVREWKWIWSHHQLLRSIDSWNSLIG